MFTIEDQGLILDAAEQPDERRISYFTALCPLSSGTILCGCQTGSAKHAVDSTIGLRRSTDGGRTWHASRSRFDGVVDGLAGSFGAAELIEAKPGRLLLFATWFDRSEPDRPLFDPVSEGILRSKQLLAVSDDEGQTFGPWQELDVGGLKGCSLTGPVIRWGDGTIGFAFESFKEYDNPAPGRHAAWLMTSPDGGRSFAPPVLVAQHPQHRVYYWDQRLCAGRAPGEFTALFWTHDLAAKRDLSVHLRNGRRDAAMKPSDAPQATTLPGQIAAPLFFDDGRLLAFVVDRGRPGTMTLWCSRDSGASWPERDRLIIYTHDERAAVTQGRENVDFKQYWEDMGKWSFGHPAIRRLDDCHVLLAWYAGTPERMSLRWARVNVSEGANR